MTRYRFKLSLKGIKSLYNHLSSLLGTTLGNNWKCQWNCISRMRKCDDHEKTWKLYKNTTFKWTCVEFCH